MQGNNTTTPTLKGQESRPAAARLQIAASLKPGAPKLIDRLREALRARHYSRRTEQTYCHWIKRYIFFHQVRHPSEMAEPPDQCLPDAPGGQRGGQLLDPESGPLRLVVPVSPCPG